MSRGRMILAAGALSLVAFVLLGTATVAGWEYSNSDAFCANACHGVHPEEPYAHQMGHHAHVACVECHIGRLPTFASLAEKSGHITHAWSFFAGYERPLHAPSFSGATRSCEGCHTKEPHRHNIVKSNKRFESDRRNTEKRLTLTMRLGGRIFGGEDAKGVNWHASGAVRFISDDPQKLSIRWVEATLPDGSKRVFNDVSAPLTAGEIEQSDVDVMDCSDCHNRAGHPFMNPEEVVDQALADGRMSPDLPHVKARALELLEEDFESEEEAMELVQRAWERYQEDFPELEERNPEAWADAHEFLQERQEFMADLMVRSRFVGEGVSWRSFPDHNGHKSDPGCFRCHNGRLQTDVGQPIPVNCTNCHSVPLVTRRDRIPDFFLSLIDKPRPDFHRDPAFMATHMDVAGEGCESCHGDIRYGVNDRSYCSNSGCHGETWEFLDLDALRRADEAARAD